MNPFVRRSLAWAAAEGAVLVGPIALTIGLYAWQHPERAPCTSLVWRWYFLPPVCSMARDPDEEGRDRLVQLLGRPLLLIFWSLVMWGTFYGFLLAHAFVEGPGTVLHRVLSGRDLLGGPLNLVLSAGAAVVWFAVGITIWRRRKTRRGA